jgi:hypothetical protein
MWPKSIKKWSKFELRWVLLKQNEDIISKLQPKLDEVESKLFQLPFNKIKVGLVQKQIEM